MQRVLPAVIAGLLGAAFSVMEAAAQGSPAYVDQVAGDSPAYIRQADPTAAPAGRGLATVRQLPETARPIPPAPPRQRARPRQRPSPPQVAQVPAQPGLPSVGAGVTLALASREAVVTFPNVGSGLARR